MNAEQQNTLSEFESGGMGLPWQDLVRSVFRHRKAVLTILAFTVLAATVRAWTLPPVYKARSVLMVKAERGREVLTAGAETKSVVDRVGTGQVNELAKLLTDPTIVRQALERIRGGSQEAAAEVAGGFPNLLELPSAFYNRLHGVPVASELDQRAANLARLVQVEPVPKTSLLELKFYSGNPEWASHFVNTLGETVIDKYRGMTDNSDRQEFFARQREGAAERLADAQGRLSEFRAEFDADLLTQSPSELRSRIAELVSALDQARTERAAQVARNSALEVEVETSTALASLKKRIIELEIERSELRSRYTKSSVAVRDIDRQIAEAKRLYDRERNAQLTLRRGSAQTGVDAIQARIETIEAQISEARGKLERLEGVGPEWERLENEVASAKEAYQTYTRKEEEARFSTALDESNFVNVAVVEPAKRPTTPESSPMRRLIALGAVFGLALGVGFALLRDWLDPSIKTTTQAERLTGLPVLGEIQG